MIVKRRDNLVIDDAFAVIGDTGRDGIDGRNGVDGRDGVVGRAGVDGQGFRWHGTWKRGSYEAYSVVEHEGSTYVATKATTKEPPHASWDLMCLRGEQGERGEDGIGQRGRPGRDGGAGIGTDLELMFDNSAAAGQLVRSSGDDRCAIANSLGYYESLDCLGLVVENTPAGNRGRVRALGLLTLPNWSLITGCESLHPSRSYALQGYGKLVSGDVCNAAFYVPVGTAITRDTLLITPGQTLPFVRSIDPIQAPSVSTLPKGTPVRLSGTSSVDAASMPDNWWAAGVLTEDVEAGQTATYKRATTISRSDWSGLLESGDTLLVKDQAYYLADSPGKLTTDDTERLYVGKATSTSVLNVHVGNPGPLGTLRV